MQLLLWMIMWMCRHTVGMVYFVCYGGMVLRLCKIIVVLHCQDSLLEVKRYNSIVILVCHQVCPTKPSCYMYSGIYCAFIMTLVSPHFSIIHVTDLGAFTNTSPPYHLSAIDKYCYIIFHMPYMCLIHVN